MRSSALEEHNKQPISELLNDQLPFHAQASFLQDHANLILEDILQPTVDVSYILVTSQDMSQPYVAEKISCATRLFENFNAMSGEIICILYLFYKLKNLINIGNIHVQSMEFNRNYGDIQKRMLDFVEKSDLNTLKYINIFDMSIDERIKRIEYFSEVITNILHDEIKKFQNQYRHSIISLFQCATKKHSGDLFDKNAVSMITRYMR